MRVLGGVERMMRLELFSICFLSEFLCILSISFCSTLTHVQSGLCVTSTVKWIQNNSLIFSEFSQIETNTQDMCYNVKNKIVERSRSVRGWKKPFRGKQMERLLKEKERKMITLKNGSELIGEHFI